MDIERLFATKPATRRIAVAGIPLGSPGMEMGESRDAFDVFVFDTNGDRTIFASYPAAKLKSCNLWVLDQITSCCMDFGMRFGFGRSVGVVVALCLTFTITFMPIIAQQAIASHHAAAGTFSEVLVPSAIHSHEANAATSCEESPDNSTSEEQSNCCEMNCSSFATVAIELGQFLVGVSSRHFQVDADQLVSRVNFGLMRPPRV